MEGAEATLESTGLETEVQSATPVESPAEVSSEEIAAKPEVAAAFERVFGGKKAAEAAAETGEAGEDAPTAEDEAAEEPGSAKPQPKTPPKAKPAAQPAQEEQGEEATATLNPVLRQAAKRAGLSDEQIDRAFNADPETFETVYGNTHKFFNELSARYAQMGRGNPPQPAATQPATQQQQQQRDLNAILSNLDKFAENNGQDMADVMRQLGKEVIEPFRRMQAAYDAQIRQTQASEVTRTFEAFEKDFADLYGTKGQFAPVQWQARQQVAQIADQIRLGASHQGIDMGLTEALERAHALFTADRVQQQARQQITQQVKKRTAALSARPTQRKTPVGSGKGDKSALSAVESWWANRE